ncbi:MAG: CDP-alcohol phosphatidyltransferase family protein [Christensenellales bacterium]
MIGYYNKSVVATYLGLISAVTGIRFAILGEMRIALLCLMFSGLCDMIDGPIARGCRRSPDEQSFGIQIDSLCDLVCFGALPAVICLMADGKAWYTTAIAGYYMLAAVIRLGYFNVQEISRVRSDPGRRKVYDGLPVTSAALIFPAFAAIDAALGAKMGGFYALPLAAVGVLFIAPFHIPKLHTRGLIACGLIGAAIFAAVIALGGNLTYL